MPNIDSIVLPKPSPSKTWQRRRYKMSEKERRRHIERAREWQKKNPDKHSKYVNMTYWRVKLKAFEKLGKKCKKCGFDDARALTVNHLIQKENREESGIKTYRKVINDPEAVKHYEILCMNCNFIYEYEKGRLRLPVKP